MNGCGYRLVVLCCVIAVTAGCASRRPAPVVDRLPPAAAKPAAPSAAPAPQPETYVVKRGDTLYSIALDQGVDWRDLAAWNQLSDPTKLSVGQSLVVRRSAPVSEGPVTVSPVAPSQPIAVRPLGADAPPGAAPAAGAATAAAGALRTEPKGVRLPYSDENLAALQRGDAARAAAPAPAPPPVAAPAPKPEPPPVAKIEPAPTPKPEPDGPEERVDWSWPTAGRVVANFNGAGNKGLDIGGRVGDPVYASAGGKVVYSGEGIPAYGKLVIIRHNGTYLSAYAHNSQILVKEGQSVSKGQKIAELGSSGADSTKLHFEIRRLGKPVDPLQYLPNRPN
ncbi:MAG TPA: peptidoglycan DD-metalloendopeptidase family protein [Burkholderiales bacterium]|nr:peptidoglycan DD-metalloendopeptidase family protein [Burkholderiales bacterium]